MGLICCFHNQVKACCAICIPKKKFSPPINYRVSDERIVVGEEIMPGTNLSNPYENHSQTSESQLVGGKSARAVNNEKQTKS